MALYRVSKICNHAITQLCKISENLRKMSENLRKSLAKESKSRKPDINYLFFFLLQNLTKFFKLYRFIWHFSRISQRKIFDQKISSSQKDSLLDSLGSERSPPG